MLEKLLRLAAKAGTINSGDLAQQLNVSHALVDQMLEELVRRGYLRIMGQGCPVSCEKCPWHKTWPHDRQPRLWLLTLKAQRLLRREFSASPQHPQFPCQQPRGGHPAPDPGNTGNEAFSCIPKITSI